MKTLKEINEIMEALRVASLSIDLEDVSYVSEMMRTAAKFDSEYADAYDKMHIIFMCALSDRTVPEPIKPIEPETVDEAIDKINKMGEESLARLHQGFEDLAEKTKAEARRFLKEAEERDKAEARRFLKEAEERDKAENEEATTQEAADFREVEVPTTSEPEAPIIFQHPDYPTIGAGTDGQVYALKDGKWKKADTRTVYFPRKKDGTWGRIERQEILDLLNNHNTSAWDEPQAESVEEYEKLPEGYFVHPTYANIAANEDGKILKVDDNNKWAPAETVEDNRGCRKVRGERIGTGKCVYECINRRVVKGHVRHLNGNSWDDAFSNLTVYGDKNYHKFQQRTYGESDIHEICEYICKHNGDVSNISKDSKGKYSIYYARKILTKSIHDQISDKYFGYTSGGTLKIYKEGDVK